MGAAENAPFEIRRADFFAVAYVLLGVLFIGLSGASLFDGGSFSVPSVLNVVVGFLWFALAGYYHFRPGSMDNGTEPTPRTWFEVAGVLIACAVLAVVVEVLLGGLNSPLF